MTTKPRIFGNAANKVAIATASELIIAPLKLSIWFMDFSLLVVAVLVPVMEPFSPSGTPCATKFEERVSNNAMGAKSEVVARCCSPAYTEAVSFGLQISLRRRAVGSAACGFLSR